MNALTQYAAPIGRLFISFIFIMAGITKITGYAGTVGYMESQGVPGALLPAVILTELGFGILVLIGFKTRIAAFLLAGFTILAALFFHTNFAEQMQQILFMKNIAIAGGLLFLVANGPGILSIDNRQRSTPDNLATTA